MTQNASGIFLEAMQPKNRQERGSVQTLRTGSLALLSKDRLAPAN